MYRSLFARDVLSELDRLQRGMNSFFDFSPSIRGLARGSYPALNLSGSPQSVEVDVFAPGLDPASIELSLDRGVLTVAGERAAAPLPQSDAKATWHLNERFAGRFRRVVSLPEDIDSSAVTARYADGVLHVSIPRRAAVQPRRITVQ